MRENKHIIGFFFFFSFSFWEKEAVNISIKK